MERQTGEKSNTTNGLEFYMQRMKFSTLLSAVLAAFFGCPRKCHSLVCTRPGEAEIDGECRPCPAGTYDAGTLCLACEHAIVVQTSSLDYTGSIIRCGKFESSGYWSLAATGSVGVDSSLDWSLSKSSSVSNGVRHSLFFAYSLLALLGESGRNLMEQTKLDEGSWNEGFEGTVFDCTWQTNVGNENITHACYLLLILGFG